MSFLKLIDKGTMDFISMISKMEDPEIEIVIPKNYLYKGKKWDIIILIRDQKKEKNIGKEK